MAWDALNGQTVLFGGYSALDGVLGETWSYDGLGWLEVIPPDPTGITAPLPQYNHALAFDAARGVTVFFGEPADTWTLSADAWTNTGVSGPAARSAHAMTYDSVNQRVLLFGGYCCVPTQHLDDLWSWDGAGWQPVTAGPIVGRFDHAMAFDELRGVLVVYGGETAGGIVGDVWEWDGGSWADRTPLMPGPDGDPGARNASAMAYLPTLGRVVLFGGLGDNAMWSWDGAGWSIVPPGPPGPQGLPGQHNEHAIVVDRGRNTVVLFGGSADPGDTWEFIAP